MSGNLTETELELYRVQQRYRSLRYFIVTSGIVGTVWGIGFFTWKILSIEQDPWTTLILTVASALALGAGPGLVWVGRFRRFVRQTLSRNAALEKKDDPNRTSSDLLEDGRSGDDL